MKYETEDMARANPRRRLPLPAFGAQFLRRLRRNQYVNPKIFADVPGYRTTEVRSDKSGLDYATGRELAGQIKGHSLLAVCDHDPWSHYWPVADLEVLVNWSSPYAPEELLTPLSKEIEQPIVVDITHVGSHREPRSVRQRLLNDVRERALRCMRPRLNWALA